MSEEDAIDSYWKGIVELFWKLRNRSTTVERKILRSFGIDRKLLRTPEQERTVG